jgi:hypothetical protein
MGIHPRSIIEEATVKQPIFAKAVVQKDDKPDEQGTDMVM